MINDFLAIQKIYEKQNACKKLLHTIFGLNFPLSEYLLNF
jgi:hypothetical protein